MVMVKEVGKSDNLIPSLRVVIPPLVLHSVSSTIYYHYVVQYMLYYTSYIIYYPTQGDTPPMVLISFSTNTKQRYTDSLASRVQQANQKFVMRHFQGMIMLQHNLGSKIYFYSCEITTTFSLFTKQALTSWMKGIDISRNLVEYTISTGTTIYPCAGAR